MLSQATSKTKKSRAIVIGSDFVGPAVAIRLLYRGRALFYLVGAGTHSGAGVPGVVTSADVVDRVVPDP